MSWINNKTIIVKISIWYQVFVDNLIAVSHDYISK